MTEPIDLYDLLPAVHRHEDAGLGYPLEALLGIISAEVGHVQRNITDLWDDFFIETAAEWVVPYLAELVGATPLHDVAGGRRADVANTIAYRRRKGTRAMLEDMAADVTGWGARVVVFFELLGWTQHLDHLRRTPSGRFGRSTRVGTADVGDVNGLDLLDGPFDHVAHTVDVRPFGERRGRHNLRKIGFFLWRLQSYPLFGVDARRSGTAPHGYHVSPLGNAAPLFTNSERSGVSEPREADLPGPVRRLALHADLEEAARTGSDASRYYGPDSHHSLAVAIGDRAGEFRDGLVPAQQVCVCDLRDWARPPTGKRVAVDPVRGRLTVSADDEPGDGEAVRVNFGYGFSGGAGGDLGGGPYDRRGSLEPRRPGDYYAAVARRRPQEVPSAEWHRTLGDALGGWQAQPDPAPRAVIEFFDSATYTEDLVVELAENRTLEIRARSAQRPVLDAATVEAGGQQDGRLVVDGLVVLGAPVRIGAGLSALVLRHCTLVPGRSFTAEGGTAAPGAPSIVAGEDAGRCHVTVANAILGPVRIPAESFTLAAADSIVDAAGGGLAIAGRDDEPGPTCDLRRVTVLGDVLVRSLGYASEVLFDGAVTSERTQVGCVRFSWVPEGATTPARYRCQPDLALERAGEVGVRSRELTRLRPRFTARQYGQPGYAQLTAGTAVELRTGAADGSQMGAFNRLREPQREANLRLRLEEYLPAGLDPGLLYVT